MSDRSPPSPDDPDYGTFPLRSFLGFDFVVVAPGRVTATLDVTEKHLNPNGVVHGGVLFTLVDTAMGRATMSVLDENQACASIEASSRFLRPVGAGKLVADVSVLRAGRRVVHLEGRVAKAGEDRPVALMTGSFAVLDC